MYEKYWVFINLNALKFYKKSINKLSLCVIYTEDPIRIILTKIVLYEMQ